MKDVKKRLLLLFLLANLGCSHYRFSNQYVELPKGARSIAIEAVFDTSRIPIPHEVLWGSLQKEFAARGHLKVTNSEQADLYVTTLIRNTLTRQHDVESSLHRYEPKKFLNPETQAPFLPNEYLDMNTADQFSKKEDLAFVVEVEVWDLRHKTKLMSKDYNISGTYNIAQTRSTLETRFIRTDESFEALFASLVKRLSANIVNDVYALSL